VICAPVCGEVLGGRRKWCSGQRTASRGRSAVRCDIIALMFKKKLTHFVGTLDPVKTAELNRALARALEIELR
jgi:hypothetical protein